jgi:hypothetical protein
MSVCVRHKIMLVEFGQVGLTVNDILLKDIYHFLQPLFLEEHPPTCLFVFYRDIQKEKKSMSLGKMSAGIFPHDSTREEG